MAAQTTKLKITKDGTTENVTSYSTSAEAKPKTARNSDNTVVGTTWTINNNGVTGYIGLWPASGTSGGNTNHSVMKINKSGTSYWVEKTVNNLLKLTLGATTHQTITLKYTEPGASQVTKTSTSSAQSWNVESGTTYTATLAADTGYTKGTLSSSSGGLYKAAVSVTATAATAITPKITFTKTGVSSTYDDIKVTYTNTSGTSTTSGVDPASVTIKYNTKITIKSNGGIPSTSGLQIQIKDGSTVKGTLTSSVDSWTSPNLTANKTYTLNAVNDGSQSGGEGDCA